MKIVDHGATWTSDHSETIFRHVFPGKGLWDTMNDDTEDNWDSDGHNVIGNPKLKPGLNQNITLPCYFDNEN